jgi:hypothetical protein
MRIPVNVTTAVTDGGTDRSFAGSFHRVKAIFRIENCPEPISGVVLIASGSIHLPSYQGKLRWSVRTLATVSSITGPILGYFPMHPNWFWWP